MEKRHERDALDRGIAIYLGVLVTLTTALAVVVVLTRGWGNG